MCILECIFSFPTTAEKGFHNLCHMSARPAALSWTSRLTQCGPCWDRLQLCPPCQTQGYINRAYIRKYLQLLLCRLLHLIHLFFKFHISAFSKKSSHNFWPINLHEWLISSIWLLIRIFKNHSNSYQWVIKTNLWFFEMNWLKSDISMTCLQASFTLVKMIIYPKKYFTQ